MSKRRSNQQLLLLEDVDNLGRKGDIVKGAKPGFIRNFLLPQRQAIIADKRAVRMQERLKEERVKQAAVDKKEAEAISVQLKDKTYTHVVKVDATGHMYGSVSTQDIVHILEAEGLKIQRKMVLIGQPIRALGIHRIPLRLKEGVEAAFSLRVQDEQGRIEIEQPKVEEKPATGEFEEEQEAAAEVEQEILREDEEQG